jgi:hypothetical protein
MRQKGGRTLRPNTPIAYSRFQKREEWNGRCVFRPHGKWYDAAMNVLWHYAW